MNAPFTSLACVCVHQSSAAAAVQHSDQVFSSMRAVVDSRIRQQEQTAQSQLQEITTHLEEELAQLERTHTELEHLDTTEDHAHFIQVDFII